MRALDDAEHRDRKGVLLVARSPESVARVRAMADRQWQDAATRWPARGRVVLFDEAARVLTASALAWVGAPPGARRLPGRTQDLVTIVDRFGSPATRSPLACASGRSAGPVRWCATCVPGA